MILFIGDLLPRGTALSACLLPAAHPRDCGGEPGSQHALKKEQKTRALPRDAPFSQKIWHRGKSLANCRGNLNVPLCIVLLRFHECVSEELKLTGFFIRFSVASAVPLWQVILYLSTAIKLALCIQSSSQCPIQRLPFLSHTHGL